MVFLIRAMRSHPELRRFKIVLVTDRTDSRSSSAIPPGSPARPSRSPGARPRCGNCCARTARPW